MLLGFVPSWSFAGELHGCQCGRRRRRLVAAEVRDPKTSGRIDRKGWFLAAAAATSVGDREKPAPCGGASCFVVSVRDVTVPTNRRKKLAPCGGVSGFVVGVREVAAPFLATAAAAS
uniref:Uncharacterized protein n=1 Tax=Oryza meridionalis TaxID=40149 RepID=A0A0E0DAE6_9ORYZ